MIKSPSVQSNNKSLYNIENYKKNFSNKLEEYTNTYVLLIKTFIHLICESSEITEFEYCEFIILRGIECLAHIYNILLLYTKNIELVTFHCNKATHYFIEFVSQIGNDSHSFLQLNTKDAILFVYKKTIFDINQEYRTNYKYEEQDKIYVNTIKTFTLCINKLINIIIKSYKNNNKKKDVISCKNFFKYSNEKIDLIFNKTYYNNTSLENNKTFVINTLTVIEFFMLKELNIDNLSYIESFIKKIHKNKYDNKKLHNKLQHPDFDDNRNNLSINKLIKWVLD